MTLLFLYLKDFRNYPHLEISLTPGVSCFFGRNAQGKTNLLEACHYLSMLTSPRAERDSDLSRWGTEGFTVGARLNGEKTTYVRIQVTVSPSLRKRIEIDDNRAKRSDLLKVFSCVYFSPDDLYTVKKGSSLRRKYLDTLLSAVDNGYPGKLSRFEDTVARRNVVLKRLFHDDSWKKTLEDLDHLLVTTGSAVLKARLGLLETLADHISGTYRFIANESCQVSYVSSVGQILNDERQIKDFYRSRLAEVKGDERSRGVTLIGPHRDDLVISLDGRPVRYFGSQGQQRSVALALRMAEAKVLEDTYGRKPALLLDDVFSELDEKRRHKVISLCEFGHQILLTSTDPVTDEDHSFQLFRVSDNSVVSVL